MKLEESMSIGLGSVYDTHTHTHIYIYIYIYTYIYTYITYIHIEIYNVDVCKYMIYKVTCNVYIIIYIYIYIYNGVQGISRNYAQQLCGNFKPLRPKFKNHRRFFQEAGQKSRN